MDSTLERNHFEKMSLSDLKQYLKARGVSVTRYLKPALVAMAKSAEKKLIPVLDCAKSKEENKLIIHGVEIEDPLSSGHEYVNVLTHRRHLVFSIFSTISYTILQNMINKGLPHTKHLMTIVFLKRDILNLYYQSHYPVWECIYM